jgi:tRNA G18 (ribose-2'-O)-methylase SpoU
MTDHKEICILLNNIRSAQNVGSIFRTADATGISKIYLCGYTPAPTDRFGRPVSRLVKASLGAEKNVPWVKDAEAGETIRNLKKNGFFIVAVEQAGKSADYKKIKPRAKTLFVYGNEVSGLPKSLMSLADIVAEIPMKGKKESLNVSVAVGVSLFRILRI